MSTRSSVFHSVGNSRFAVNFWTRAVSICLLVVASSPQHQRDCLRMINLDAPDSAIQGDTIQLSCFFSLKGDIGGDSDVNHKQHKQSRADEHSGFSSDFSVGELGSSRAKPHASLFSEGKGEQTQRQYNTNQRLEASGDIQVLYAIKWYKDEREIFRFLAQDWPRKQSFPMDGVAIDVDNSNNHTIILRNVSLKSSGSFKCEVSTDAPHFVTKSMERKLAVYSLPNEGPVIEHLSHNPSFSSATRVLKAKLGDKFDLFCSSAESKPPAALDWVINGNLNLSSTSWLGKHDDDKNRSKSWKVFDVSSSRLVRLPETFSQFKSASSAPQKNKKLSVPLRTYEVRNESYLSPVTVEGERAVTDSPPLRLVGNSLEQFVEMSTSRLKFSVDADLLQLLSDLSIVQQGSSRQRTQLDEYMGSSRSKPNVKLTHKRMPVPTRTKKGRRSTNSSNHIDTNQVEDPSGRNPMLLTLERSNRHLLDPKDRSEITNSPSHRYFMLSIKCIARILHLNMSDEVRILMANRTAKSQDPIFHRSTGKQHLWDNGKNSAASLGITTLADFNLHRFVVLMICTSALIKFIIMS